MRVYFEVEGKVESKLRPRVYGNHAVTPQKTINAENWIRLKYQQATKEKFEGALHIVINAFYEMPASKVKTLKAKAKFLFDNPYPTKKPDFDNVAKLVCDSLNGIAYKDDAYIVSAEVNKFWSNDYIGLKIEISNK